MQLAEKKKLGLRWADSPRNFVLKEEDLLTQAEKTPEHRVPPLHRGPLPCEWAGPLPVLWETRDRRGDFFNSGQANERTRGGSNPARESTNMA